MMIKNALLCARPSIKSCNEVIEKLVLSITISLQYFGRQSCGDYVTYH